MYNLCDLANNLREKIGTYNKLLIIPHWDIDGIASSSILLEIFNDIVELKVAIPLIGYYDYNAIPHNEIDLIRPDGILFVDYALTTEVLIKVYNRYTCNIMVIDHHANPLPQKFYVLNPYLCGLNSDEYPSTTWVLAETLYRNINLRVILGLAGDLNKYLEKHRVWRRVKGYINMKKWNLNDIYKLKNYINAAYQILDPELVKRSIYKLRDYKDSLEHALHDKEWKKSFSAIEKEINKVLDSIEGIEIGNKILYYIVESNYLIASKIGKILAYKNPDKIIVLNVKLKNGYKSIYVRSYSHNLLPILKDIRTLGFNAGGKKEVFSIILDSENQDIIKKIFNIISSYY